MIGSHHHHHPLLYKTMSCGCFGGPFSQKKQISGPSVREVEGQLLQNIRQFSYNELRAATDNFNLNNKIGRGGFGIVFERTKYELVDSMISSGFVRGVVWYHCNFTARNGISSEEGPCDSTTKLFFTELKVVALKSDNYKYLVTACRPIDGAKAVTGCGECEEMIQHPSHGFRQGLHRLKPRALRPRNNGKVARKI